MTTENQGAWTDVAAAADLTPDDVTAIAGPAGEIALYSVDAASRRPSRCVATR